MIRIAWPESPSFCPAIAPSWARMIRPSSPPSAPSCWRRPWGMVSCTRSRNLNLGLAYEPQGDYRRAIDCCGQTVTALDGVRRRERLGQVILPAVQARAWLAWCHAELGTFGEGSAFGDEGLRIAEAVAHPGSLMVASWGIGLLALRQGDLRRASPARTGPPYLSRHGPHDLAPLDGCGLGGGVYAKRARCGRHAAARAGAGTGHGNSQARTSGGM